MFKILEGEKTPWTENTVSGKAVFQKLGSDKNFCRQTKAEGVCLHQISLKRKASWELFKLKEKHTN
jgi:hypothetical protein